jgi:hypothetical protein
MNDKSINIFVKNFCRSLLNESKNITCLNVKKIKAIYETYNFFVNQMELANIHDETESEYEYSSINKNDDILHIMKKLSNETKKYRKRGIKRSIIITPQNIITLKN